MCRLTVSAFDSDQTRIFSGPTFNVELATLNPQRLDIFRFARVQAGTPVRVREMTKSAGALPLNVNASEQKLWREQCRNQLGRDVLTRIKYGFCHVHKPILDDVPVRAFTTMKEYREWCAQTLPPYLGYRLVAGPHSNAR